MNQIVRIKPASGLPPHGTTRLVAKPPAAKPATVKRVPFGLPTADEGESGDEEKNSVLAAAAVMRGETAAMIASEESMTAQISAGTEDGDAEDADTDSGNDGDFESGGDAEGGEHSGADDDTDTDTDSDAETGVNIDAMFGSVPMSSTQRPTAVSFDDADDTDADDDALAEGGESLELPILVADETGARAAVIQVYSGNCFRCSGFMPPEHRDHLAEEAPMLKFEKMKCAPHKKPGGNPLCPAQHVRVEVVGARMNMLRRLTKARESGNTTRFMEVLTDLQKPEHDAHRDWVLQQAGVIAG